MKTQAHPIILTHPHILQKNKIKLIFHVPSHVSLFASVDFLSGSLPILCLSLSLALSLSLSLLIFLKRLDPADPNLLYSCFFTLCLDWWQSRPLFSWSFRDTLFVVWALSCSLLFSLVLGLLLVHTVLLFMG